MCLSQSPGVLMMKNDIMMMLSVPKPFACDIANHSALPEYMTVISHIYFYSQMVLNPQLLGLPASIQSLAFKLTVLLLSFKYLKNIC